MGCRSEGEDDFFDLAHAAAAQDPGATLQRVQLALAGQLAGQHPALAGRHVRGDLGAEEHAHLAHVLRSEEHTSELQSQSNLVCRLLLEKKKKQTGKLLRELPHTTSLKCRTHVRTQ